VTEQADGSFAPPILRFTGVPLAQITGPAAETTTEIGQSRIWFLGDGRLTFQYTIGGSTQTKQLERFAFGDSDLACSTSPQLSRADADNFSDLWSSPGSDGWGVHISHIGDALFASWYTYDDVSRATPSREAWFDSRTGHPIRRFRARHPWTGNRTHKALRR
jgi:hypothetical protein